MDLLGLMLAVALSGASGYGLGRRVPSQLRRGPLLERLERQDKRISEMEINLRALSAEEPVNPVRVDNLEKACRRHDLQLAMHTGVHETLEKHTKENHEHTTGLARDTLALGSELKAQLSQLELDLDARLNALSERQGELLDAMTQQLDAMQTYIVQAAEEAQQRRQALEAAAATAAPLMTNVMTPSMEAAALFEKQRQAQTVFAARRRAQAEAGFPGIQGAGL